MLHHTPTSGMTSRKYERAVPTGRGTDSCGVASVSQTISPASRYMPVVAAEAVDGGR